MHQVGESIYYGGTGVCEVTDISMRRFPGIEKEQLFYTLKPLFHDFVIHTPVNNTKVFMRAVITKEEAIALIDLIPTMQAEAYHSKVMSQLSAHYEASFKSHDCADLIELTLSIYAKKQAAAELKQKIGSMDENFMKRAEELLHSELSVALGISKDEVPEYIASRVAALTKQAASDRT